MLWESLGVVSFLGWQNEAKWTNMDQYGAKRIPKGSPKLPKPKGNKNKRQNDFQKRSVLGHPKPLGVLGPGSLF